MPSTGPTTAPGLPPASTIEDFGPTAPPDLGPKDAVDRREAFLGAPADQQTVSLKRLSSPAGPYVVQAGTTIPAALVTGLRSDFRDRSSPR